MFLSQHLPYFSRHGLKGLKIVMANPNELKEYFERVETQDDGSLDLREECFTRYYSEYHESPNYKDLIKRDVNSEYSTRDSYVGREILEMIQNADDQGSDYIGIYLNSENKEISFINGGKPFQYAGFKAIMLGNTSTKAKALSSIGNKGLGFRSILNWGNTVEIYSRKVHCSFSREIAKKKWEDLKSNFKLAAQNDILENARKQKIDLEVPISIFAVPEYKPLTDSEYPHYNNIKQSEIAAIIKVHYKEDKKDDICKQINLLSGNTLIFLRKIKKIIIDIDGNTKTYLSQFYDDKPLKNGTIKKCTLNINGIEENWTVYKEIGDYPAAANCSIEEGYQIPEQYEIGFAVKKDDVENHPLHVFFKTDEPIGLPCIIHGTFFLNPNRKQMNDGNAYNNWLQELMGDRLLDFVEYIASNQEKNGYIDCWPYKILNFFGDTSKRLQIFRKKIEEGKIARRIYPTISEGYKAYKDIVFYNIAFAHYIQSTPISWKAELGNHVIPEFTSFLFNKKDDPKIFDKLSNASKLINENIELKAPDDVLPKDRANFIAAIIDAQINTKPRVLNILIDDQKKLLEASDEKKPIINTGVELESPPEILGINYVSGELVSQLENKHIQNLENAETEERKIAKTMDSRFTNVTYGDINGIKRRITSIITKCNEDMFKKIITCLYNTNKKHDIGSFEFQKKNDDHGADLTRLKLMNANGQYKDANFLVLYDKEYPNGLENLIPQDIRNTIKDSIKSNLLWGSLDDWKTILSETDSEQIQKFFTEKLGISLYIPQKFETSVFANKDYYKFLLQNKKNNLKPFYHFQNAEKNERYQYINSAYWVDHNFINNLSKNKISLENVLLALLKNNRLFDSLKKTKWTYNFNSYNLEVSVTCSYTAFTLTQYKNSFYKQVNSIFLDDSAGNTLIENLHQQTGRGKEDISSILIQLGAKKKELLDIDELYAHIADITQEFIDNPKTSIQTKYKEVRKLILDYKKNNPISTILIKKHVDNLKSRGHLVAIRQGKRDVYDVKNVYYWDNKKLPQHVLDSIPKLDIGSRVGERSVSEIFGVKLLNEIQFTIVDSIKNETLDPEIKDYLTERRKYILAAICDDARNQIDTYAPKLKNFNEKICILKNCSYKIKDSETINKMIPGDLLISDSNYNICFTGNDLQQSINFPQFIESLIESLCTALLLAEDIWYDKFWKILSQSVEANDYDYAKYDDPDYKIKIGEALDISENDIYFWEKVAENKKINLDNKQIFCEGFVRFQYVQETFGIDLSRDFAGILPEIDDMTGLQQYILLTKLKFENSDILNGFNKIPQYYDDCLKDIVEEYSTKYNHLLYDEIDSITIPSNRLEQAKQFLKKTYAFKAFDYSSIIKIHENQITPLDLLQKELDDLMKQSDYKDVFENLKNIDPKSYRTLDKYQSILEQYGFTRANLTLELQGLTLFKGFEEELKKELEALRKTSDNENKQESADSNTTTTTEDTTSSGIVLLSEENDWQCLRKNNKDKKNPPSDKDNPSDQNTKPKPPHIPTPFASDLDKNKSGEEAENKVVEELKKYPKKYDIVKLYSRNLDTAGGVDEHYDLTYKLLENNPNEIRFLEIKSMTGNGILMSVGEYEFAIQKENINRYDLAIVKDGKVHIILNPFATGKMKPQTETYKFLLKLKK